MGTQKNDACSDRKFFHAIILLKICNNYLFISLGWIESNLQNGIYGTFTRQMLKSYWRMVEQMEEVYLRIIHTMPTDEEKGFDNIQKAYIHSMKVLQESAVTFLENNIVHFTRSSVSALHPFYPPARDPMNSEFYNFMSGITYERTNGQVFGVPNFPRPPKGDYYIEAAPSDLAKMYLRLTSDWGAGYHQTFETKIKRTFPARSREDNYDKWNLGYKITLDYSDKKKHSYTKIKIEEPSNAPYHGARTLTFEQDNARITYLTYSSIDRQLGNTPIFAEDSKLSHVRRFNINVDKFFR